MVKCEVIGHDGGILEKLFFLRVYKQRRSPGEKKNKQTKTKTNKQTRKTRKRKGELSSQHLDLMPGQ